MKPFIRTSLSLNMKPLFLRFKSICLLSISPILCLKCLHSSYSLLLVFRNTMYLDGKKRSSTSVITTDEIFACVYGTKNFILYHLFSTHLCIAYLSPQRVIQIAMVKSSCEEALKELKQWMKPEKVTELQ